MVTFTNIGIPFVGCKSFPVDGHTVKVCGRGWEHEALGIPYPGLDIYWDGEFIGMLSSAFSGGAVDNVVFDINFKGGYLPPDSHCPTVACYFYTKFNIEVIEVILEEAEVYLDNLYQGTTVGKAISISGLSAGVHTICARAPGFAESCVSMDVPSQASAVIKMERL